MENIYILTIESYEWTKLYGVFSDKEALLKNYLYLLEHSCDATDYPDDLGLCIYNPKINEMYMEFYYELCEGGSACRSGGWSQSSDRHPNGRWCWDR